MKVTQNEMYMANASPNARGPNATYIPAARIGHFRRALGTICSRWALLAWVAGRVGYARLFRYQHVGIPNAISMRWGSKPKQGPNAKGFALQWNIGLRIIGWACGWIQSKGKILMVRVSTKVYSRIVSLSLRVRLIESAASFGEYGRVSE